MLAIVFSVQKTPEEFVFIFLLNEHNMKLPLKHFSLYPYVVQLSILIIETSLCSGWQLI